MKNFSNTMTTPKSDRSLSIKSYLFLAFFMLISAISFSQNQINDGLRLQFSDGRPDAMGF